MKYTTEYLETLEMVDNKYYAHMQVLEDNPEKKQEWRFVHVPNAKKIKWPGNSKHLFISRDIKTGVWTTSCAHSGAAISTGRTRREAEAVMEFVFEERDFEISRAMCIEKRGLSPRYKEPIN